MKVLLIDNYDSFTFNLYQYIGEVFGVLPTVVKNNNHHVITDEFDAIIISPGPGSPYNSGDIGICEEIINSTTKPLLGICLGHQAIVANHGGKVDVADVPFHGRMSKVVHGGRGIFHNLPNPLEIIRYHSLIALQPLPESLISTAFTEDGLIMGVEHREKPIWGVQFHPESIYSECGRQLISNFKALAESYLSKEKRLFLFDDDIKHLPVNKQSTHTKYWLCKHLKLDIKASSVDVFNYFYKKSKYSFWLDSSSTNNSEARYSFMGDTSGPHAFWFSYSVDKKSIYIDKHGQLSTIPKTYSEFVGDVLSQKVEGTEELPFDFCGGLVGYQGYELKSETEFVSNLHASKYPDAAGMFVDRFITFDHKTGLIYIVAIEKEEVCDLTDSADEWIERMVNQLSQVDSFSSNENSKLIHNTELNIKPVEVVEFDLEDDVNSYVKKIEQCKEYIHRGESYEICMTNRLSSKLKVAEPLSLYRILREINPAPRSVYLHSPEFSILSSSPEKFISVGRNMVVEAKPIKGTRKRGNTEIEDQILIDDLTHSEKDHAENLMIVDLLRNDLNRVCEAGSVWVPKLMQIETYASVHQLVSTIRGRLREDESLASLFNSTFPPGSMTGAPKKRTLEILDQLENSARGIYSGSIGYMSLNGASELNVAIRTLVVDSDRIEIGVGGAVTWLSDAEEEFEEILIKGGALMKAVAKYTTGDETCYQVNGKDYQKPIEIITQTTVDKSFQYVKGSFEIEEGVEA
ncbi:aminodeoxychorismate synthase component I [Aliikangiella sp. IMCC44359]|uniref:aminodeoxychorismate synthase component I n=1 Tax=Aliikangiella sp. IMCC44359 TaxID=3459125 RepID=UPI00403AA53E